MSLWVIVPVKPFNRAKSRLREVLPDAARAALGEQFLAHTLRVAAQVPAVQHVLVVSQDEQALHLARAGGALALLEAGRPGLNGALAQATQAARAQGARAVLILPTDLPDLVAADLAALVDDQATDPLAVIAPDRRESGTNALLARPAGLFPYAFGPDSFQRHQALALRAGARVRVVRRPGTAFDLDGPQDWQAYQQRTAAASSQA